MPEPGPSTRAVHAGEAPDPTSGAVNVPIHQSTTFWFPELPGGGDGPPQGKPSPYIYSRYTNPSVEAVEAKLAALEGAPGGSLAFASGMAAISSLCATVLRPGDTLAMQRGIYGGTAAYFESELKAWGVQVAELDAVAPPASLPAGTRLVWMESITNPLLRVADVRAWARVAHAAGALLCADATFATPLLQRPLALGADVAMHSGTKYLGGHADVTAGFLSFADAALRESVFLRRRNLGPTLDPHAAFLLGRGMKTLAVRIERQVRNALGLAQACTAMPGIVAVHHPGLPHHPDHATARALLSGGFGGMVTVDLGSLERAVAFRRRLRLIAPAASLGGVESLACLPLETSHAYAPAAKRRADGVTDGLVRISVGIEDLDDLVADVRAAAAP
ncbi:MAG TPA: PLP-dependent aspartate aminotransferase family protein [Candidatus Thermoplasmatota archaeon]|nr:PLP-dependent aspartate aminotransferase family protein [Candidatus Thermoplasmatota archaeon]